LKENIYTEDDKIRNNDFLRKIEEKIFPNSTRNMNNPNKNLSLEPIDILKLIGESSSHIPINSNLLKLKLNISSFDESKCSIKSNGIVKAYGANTHQGSTRNYNEDRVAIILNMAKPSSFTGVTWPKCSYFAIYDGHCGNTCSNFLRDNLHIYVIKYHQLILDNKK